MGCGANRPTLTPLCLNGTRELRGTWWSASERARNGEGEVVEQNTPAAARRAFWWSASCSPLRTTSSVCTPQTQKASSATLVQKLFLVQRENNKDAAWCLDVIGRRGPQDRRRPKEGRRRSSTPATCLVCLSLSGILAERGPLCWSAALAAAAGGGIAECRRGRSRV